MRLWPEVRDAGRVDDPSDLDTLLATQGQPGAMGHDCGLQYTFACFPPDIEARLRLPTGELTTSDAEARFIGHLLVTRVLLGAGLAVDARVIGAMHEAYAWSWTTVGEQHRHQTPLVLAVSLWLIAFDPQADSDRPLPIDWSARCFEERDWWDPDYRLFSHYDIREQALDWSTYVAYGPDRHPGCSPWAIVEPLLCMQGDSRISIVLSQLVGADSSSASQAEQIPAAAAIERGRIAALLHAFIVSAPPEGDAIRPSG